jgi:hypothetical protein
MILATQGKANPDIGKLGGFELVTVKSTTIQVFGLLL